MENNKSYEYFNEKAYLYRKYRPNYSSKYLTYLNEVIGLSSENIIAEIGAGTGQHTSLISPLVKKIYAVEPNLEMQNECKIYLKNYNNIIYLNNTSDNIQLPNHSVNYVMVAQAMHLFNNSKTIYEFQRILQQDGKLIIVYNMKNQSSDLFLENEQVLKTYCPNYNRQIHATEFDATTFANLFQNDYKYIQFQNDNTQFLDCATFIGRTLSASYAINANNSAYKYFIQDLKKVFEKYEKDGKVKMELSTVIYSGKLER